MIREFTSRPLRRDLKRAKRDMGTYEEIRPKPPKVVERKQSARFRLGRMSMVRVYVAESSGVQEEATRGAIGGMIARWRRVTCRLKKEPECRTVQQQAVEGRSYRRGITEAPTALGAARSAIILKCSAEEGEVQLRFCYPLGRGSGPKANIRCMVAHTALLDKIHNKYSDAQREIR